MPSGKERNYRLGRLLFVVAGPFVVGLELGIFVGGIETGTGLVEAGGQIAVSADVGLGVVLVEFAQQGDEGDFLLEGTGVGGTAVDVESAFIAYPDAVIVEAAAMRADAVEGPAGVGDAVAGDVEMVADVAEAAFFDVAAAEGFDRKIPVLAGGAAVHHNERNSA
ncbi:hypothetical protein EVA_03453 [gut metagenome]|uniref:Uncharacterized protein n=1 Tax=gut metagenome TaxID=749906 RepID=J9H3Z3_9ZZZZ